VFQDPTLLPWRTVRRNVELNAELAGMDKPSRLKAANAAIDLVNLTGNEDKYPKQLSGGMKMRCSLARSLVLQPNLFLFDEPFAALDEITREHLNDELLHLFQNQNFASLFITHSIQEAVFLSTRVLVMSARPGRIIAEHAVDFAYPRHPDIRYQSNFAEICGKISADLKVAHS
jgi:NitT/TauT family transport system ATP-binding protein